MQRSVEMLGPSYQTGVMFSMCSKFAENYDIAMQNVDFSSAMSPKMLLVLLFVDKSIMSTTIFIFLHSD